MFFLNLYIWTCICKFNWHYVLRWSYIVDSIILVKVGSVLDFAHVSLVNSSSWLMGLLFMKNTIVILYSLNIVSFLIRKSFDLNYHLLVTFDCLLQIDWKKKYSNLIFDALIASPMILNQEILIIQTFQPYITVYICLNLGYTG